MRTSRWIVSFIVVAVAVSVIVGLYYFTREEVELETKLYRNEAWGFEFEYPPHLMLEDVDHSESKYKFFDTGDSCKNLMQEAFQQRRLVYQLGLIDPNFKHKFNAVSIEIYKNETNETLDEWLHFGIKFLELYAEECKHNDPEYIEIRLDTEKDIVVDGLLGVQGFEGCCMVSDRSIYVMREDNVYHFSFSGSVKAGEECVTFSDNKEACPSIDEDIYDHILSTFKFLK